MAKQAKKKTAPLDAAAVYAALRKRYDDSNGKWAVIAEVADRTAGANRRCDLLAMGCWPSAGLHLHGHEIKVNRGDWQRELDDPTKAETFARHCHYWWLVYANQAAKLEEIPAKWGAIEVLPSGVAKIRRQATKHNPEPLPWSMLASLLRTASQYYANTAFRSGELHAMYEKGREAERTIVAARLKSAEKRAKAAEATLAEIDDVIPGEWWRKSQLAREIRAAVEFLRSDGLARIGEAARLLAAERHRIGLALETLEAAAGCDCCCQGGSVEATIEQDPPT